MITISMLISTWVDQHDQLRLCSIATVITKELRLDPQVSKSRSLSGGGVIHRLEGEWVRWMQLT